MRHGSYAMSTAKASLAAISEKAGWENLDLSNNGLTDDHFTDVRLEKREMMSMARAGGYFSITPPTGLASSASVGQGFGGAGHSRGGGM